ncbi:MAG: PAS domain S-box protein [Actinomycetia bacterium]|nr:PAS domain S-box protein [Actinomycetes bacterium]MCP4224767.1 PAS domain S-box protein [Actinomycetes bacterium]MCP5030665.1 PAS domain S-box protein [Actinomycetes bacterium]
MDEVGAWIELDGRLSDLLDILGRSSDAMIAVGPDLEIIGWNDAATQMFGHKAEEVLGRRCDEVLRWRNRCGDPVCGEGCSAADLGSEDEVGETREAIGRTVDGRTRWVSVSSIVPPLELRHQCRLVHLVREVGLPPELERLVVERLEGWSPATDKEPEELEVLTRREREVLTMLTQGLDGPAIAEQLFLSQLTVRNHIQHILTKLGVHSRAEAVALAMRRR